MKKYGILSAILLMVIPVMVIPGWAQSNARQEKEIKVGGPCEGCEAVFECPVPFEALSEFAWLPDWNENSPRKIAINGIVYQADGKTPAPGVVIYLYHTDQTGVYPLKGDEKGWAKRHGYLRGWMKTNEKGEYKFWTLRPAAYPGRNTPAHIHAIIKEPGKTPYWIDDFLFDNDPLLTATERKKLENRGGNGILKFYDASSGKSPFKSERHLYLGKNIPGYPR